MNINLMPGHQFSRNSDTPEFRYNKVLLNLSRMPSIDRGDLQTSFKIITEALVEALEVGRASIWFYNTTQDAIISADLFEDCSGQHSQGVELKAKDFPTYFKYLSEERTLPIHEARTDPVTKEFDQCYLTPLDIYSLLDAPIRVNGKMIGVVCSEQLKASRIWTPQEETFMGTITEIIAKAIHAHERVVALHKLEELNRNLESLVLERTKELEDQRARAAYASNAPIICKLDLEKITDVLKELAQIKAA